MYDDYMVFIFKRGKAIYAISAESEENAYEQLQQKLNELNQDRKLELLEIFKNLLYL